MSQLLGKNKKILIFLIIAALTLSSCSHKNQNKADDEVTEQEPSSKANAKTEAGTETVAAPETESETESTPQRVNIVMVGDDLIHTPIENACQKEDGSYDYSSIFANVKEDIASADLAIINQEVIIGGSELGISGYPCFNADFSLADSIADAGFDLVLHGTNHALDKGKAGIINCIDNWESKYPQIGILGIHDSAEDQNDIYIYESNGIKIAILNYTYGTNGISLPSDMPYGVDYLSEERVISDLEKAEELADFTICCPHWGTEYMLEENDSQVEWAKLMAQHGADLIIGTHPHVIEPMAWVSENDSVEIDLAKDDYEGREIGGASTAADAQSHAGNTLVYYSLGNFVNWTSGTGSEVANRMLGGMSQVTLEKDENGQVRICQYGITPLIAHLEEGYGGVTVYKMSDYSEELAEKNAIKQQDASFSYAYCRDLAVSVW